MNELTGIPLILSNIGSVLTSLLTMVGDTFTALTDIPLFTTLVYLAIAPGLIWLTVKIIKKFTGRRKI